MEARRDLGAEAGGIVNLEKAADFIVLCGATDNGVFLELVGAVEIKKHDIWPRNRKVDRGRDPKPAFTETANHAFGPGRFGNHIDLKTSVNAARLAKLDIEIVSGACINEFQGVAVVEDAFIGTNRQGDLCSQPGEVVVIPMRQWLF